jgi:hypothetical protein
MTITEILLNAMHYLLSSCQRPTIAYNVYLILYWRAPPYAYAKSHLLLPQPASMDHVLWGVQRAHLGQVAAWCAHTLSVGEVWACRPYEPPVGPFWNLAMEAVTVLDELELALL